MPVDPATKSIPKQTATTSEGSCEQCRFDILHLRAPIWNRQRWLRLRSNINAYDRELQFRADATNLSRIRSVLEGASEALKTHDIDSAWKCFNCACRLELLDLTQEQLTAAALAMRSEASKLDGWRKAAVLKLLGDDQKGGLAERVFLASRIRDEHYDNEAYKDSLRRNSSARFAAIILFAVAALWVLSWWKHLPPPDDSDQPTMLLSVAIFGLLGATISATIAAVRPRAASRIPELVSSAQVTYLRLFMGPASAIVLYFVAQSTLFKQILNFPLNNSTLLAVALAAGFSERLVLRVVDAFAGKDQTEAPPTDRQPPS